MAIERGAIQRSSMHWIFGLQRDIDKRKAQRRHLTMVNTIQTYQTQISGVAARKVKWQEVQIRFDEIIIDDAPVNDFDHDEPHVATGYSIRSGPPVIVTAAVSGWLTDQDGSIYGATVLIGAHDPNNTKQPFSGLAHLTFFSASIPDDDAPEDDEDGEYDAQP